MPERPLRVLRVIARLNIGGPARHVTLLNSGLRRRGFDTLLLYGQPGLREGSLEDLIGECELPASRVPGLGRDVRLAADLRAFAALLRVMYSWRPDVVHTHTAKAGTLGRLAAVLYNVTRRRPNRCAIVHTYHGHVFEGYFGPVASAAVRTVERILARVTDRVVTISHRQRDDIVRRYRIAPMRKTAVVPLGLNLEPLVNIAERRDPPSIGPAWPSGAVVFGFVGRFVPIKDVPTLLRATSAAVAADPSIYLVLFGDGPQRTELTSLVTELGLETHVKFHGWQHDLRSVYQSMDVAVLSSLNEGTPVALIEAMAAGRPVIATDVGGVRDVVEAEVTGLLVPPRKPGSLAEAMLRLARSPDLRQRFGAQGRRQAPERFGTGRLVREIAVLYEQALKERRGAVRRAEVPLVQ